MKLSLREISNHHPRLARDAIQREDRQKIAEALAMKIELSKIREQIMNIE